MDSYVDLLQSHGGSLIMIAKGNRSQQVTDACRKHGGFYLGSIGGPAALLAEENIKKVECIDFPSSAWRRSGRSRSRTSPRSSWWTTRATTSSTRNGPFFVVPMALMILHRPWCGRGAGLSHNARTPALWRVRRERTIDSAVDIRDRVLTPDPERTAAVLATAPSDVAAPLRLH
jgi:hypothetical protein